jgi:uncharacterized protein YprB with RNaseH-like and TPR domain
MKGRVNYPTEAYVDDRAWARVTGQPWYTYPGYKIGYIDIEVDNLKANFGNMLTWAIKEKDGEVFTDQITKKEIFNETYDQRIVASIIEKMREFKILVSYYGKGFDLKYLRTKALKYGIPFPGFTPELNSKGHYVVRPEIFHFDLYYTVRRNLALHRKSLDVVTNYFGINGKTPIDHAVWLRAKYGHEDALAEVLHHNIGDVIILEELHDILEPHAKWTRSAL